MTGSNEHPETPIPRDTNPDAAGPVAPVAQAAHPPVAPPMYYAPPKEKGVFGRGFGLGAGAGLGAGLSLLVLGVVGSLASAMVMAGVVGAAAAAGAPSTSKVEMHKTIWGKETATKKIQAIPVTGPIMNDPSDGAGFVVGTYGYEVAERIDKLKPQDADAVVLLMNTPGGTIPGSRAMAEAVERYQARTDKKVFAFVQGMSASGGMYTMAGVDEVVSDHGSLIGSVGVISGPFLQYNDVTATTGTILTEGVTTRGGITGGYITSGKGKDFGSPWRPMTDEERTQFQSVSDHMYDDFVSWVSKNRNIPEAKIRDELGAGIFDTKGALDAGYIDAVMTRDEAFKHFAEAAGVDPNDTKVIAPTAPSFLMSLLGAESRVFGTAPAYVPQPGQPAQATASFCRSTVPMAYHGSLVGVCG